MMPALIKTVGCVSLRLVQVRGATKASLVLPGGLALPPTARLRSYEAGEA